MQEDNLQALRLGLVSLRIAAIAPRPMPETVSWLNSTSSALSRPSNHRRAATLLAVKSIGSRCVA